MRQTVLHIIIYIAVLLPLSASGQKDDGMHRYNTHELTIGKTNFVDTIPIVFAGNQVYIPVYINGQRHLFNLDTGSSQGVAYIGANTGYSAPLGNINSREGDVVVSVDDKPIRTLDEFNAIKFEKGKSYKFILLDSRGFNKEITVNIPKND